MNCESTMFRTLELSQMFPNDPSHNTNGIDWNYAMRREMQEIVPGVFLGPYAVAMKTKFQDLQSRNITHIVCVRHTIEAPFIRANFIEHIKYMVLDISDSCTENIIQYIPKVKDFIDECHSLGGSALVHGNAGISRSAALVIGYVMEKYDLSYKEASKHVQQQRFCINPNDGFAQQLTEYEPIYRARKNLVSQPGCGTLKRKFQLDAD